MTMTVALLVAIFLVLAFPKTIRFVLAIAAFGTVYLIATAAHAAAPTPYQKAGEVSCALPGMSIDFGLDGKGGAVVTAVKSNYEPFREAAKVRAWAALEVEKDGHHMLVLDNLHNARIMIAIPTEKGMAFLGEDGVSDIICQVLVQPY